MSLLDPRDVLVILVKRVCNNIDLKELNSVGLVVINKRPICISISQLSFQNFMKVQWTYVLQNDC